PVLVNEVIAADISVLNNSWASNYEISDLSKSVIAGALGAELPAWQKAVADGMVMVWAAGNDGDDEVSVSVQVSRSVTHYQKTLPFLSTAHRIVEKQLHLRISKRFGHIESIIPFVKFHHQIRHSDNPRQNGRRDAILFGLSFQL
ncbi:MAG: S8 family serine peptidase, partial [Candidatus Puniceispirillaceae bacterium]